MVDLQEGDRGLSIVPVKVSCPTFADDEAVATITKSNMNKKLDKAGIYSCMWRFAYSPCKTVANVCGKDKEPNVVVKLSG